MESLSKGLELLDKKSKNEMNYGMKKMYGEIVNLSGLIALIVRCE